MTNPKYRRTENWKREGKGFLVVVNHYTSHANEELSIYSGEGPHRWCIYAYIYPSHPHFAAFDGTENMCQPAASMMPLHDGPSFLRIHSEHSSNTITSYQVGADYNHLYDTEYTHMANEYDALSVFADADILFDWLNSK